MELLKKLAQPATLGDGVGDGMLLCFQHWSKRHCFDAWMTNKPSCHRGGVTGSIGARDSVLMLGRPTHQVVAEVERRELGHPA
jgi:hypothetical protein